VMWGAVNGWHPHTHAALLFEVPLASGQRAALRSVLFRQWQNTLRRKGFPDLHPVHGLDVRQVSGGAGLSDYLTKVDGGWSLGSELTLADRKVGGRELVAPVELLRRAVVELQDSGELGRWAGLWQEYEAATRGRRFMVWSAGLRRRLLGDVPELSDEELAASEGEDIRLVTVEFSSSQWSFYVDAGLVGELLRRIEEIAAVLLWMSGSVQHEREVA